MWASIAIVRGSCVISQILQAGRSLSLTGKEPAGCTLFHTIVRSSKRATDGLRPLPKRCSKLDPARTVVLCAKFIIRTQAHGADLY